MGRRAKSFGLRGYIIVYPHDEDNNPLYKTDYRIQRDLLRNALEREGPGALILPTAKDVEFAVCTNYKLTEESRFGGFCVFDMTFVESGIDPQQIEPNDDTRGKLNDAADGVAVDGVDALGKPDDWDGDLTAGGWGDVASSGPSGEAIGETPP